MKCIVILWGILWTLFATVRVACTHRRTQNTTTKHSDNFSCFYRRNPSLTFSYENFAAKCTIIIWLFKLFHSSQGTPVVHLKLGLQLWIVVFINISTVLWRYKQRNKSEKSEEKSDERINFRHVTILTHFPTNTRTGLTHCAVQSLCYCRIQNCETTHFRYGTWQLTLTTSLANKQRRSF
jgi:hypothetical protein